jgi:hypothetical protein
MLGAGEHGGDRGTGAGAGYMQRRTPGRAGAGAGNMQRTHTGERAAAGTGASTERAQGDGGPVRIRCSQSRHPSR